MEAILLSPGRSVQTPRELQILLAIFRKQGNNSEALKILESENLGISSRVAKGDWSLVRKKLEILEEEQLWQDEWTFCKKMLEDALPEQTDEVDGLASQIVNAQGDDWRVWQGLVRSSRQLNIEE